MKDLIEAIKMIDKDIEITFDDDTTFYLTKEEWIGEAFFETSEDLSETINDVIHFLNYKHVKNIGFINKNYIEFTIDYGNTYFIEQFEGKELNDAREQNEIYYEIGSISDDFNKLLDLYYSFHYLEPEESFTTIKIYNVDNVIGKSYKESQFTTKAIEIVKCILFDLSSKYSINLRLMYLPESDDEDFDPIYDINESLKHVNDQTLKTEYDKDLINYYYRAMQMDESEFKYLAFFQVMECIFDEVYLHENIQDIKQIINSNWFSNYRDDDITQIIKIIEQYNKNKNDREKLKLVIEKYFKANIHDEAYCLVNKEIIELLVSMDLIKNENEFKDIQRFSNFIYDFRCKCTHSNRAFPFRTTFDNSPKELSNYITLIKKVSERIIMNYGTVGFKLI